MTNLPKKILIAISLISSYLLTLALSLFLTPPYPRISTIANSINRLKNTKLKIELPSILNPFSSYLMPVSYPNLPERKITFINIHNTPPSNQPKQILLSPTPVISSSVYPSKTSAPTKTLLSPTNKPTKTPKPTPTPTFALTNPRPGKNIREIAEIVGKIMCVPPAMIYAIYDNEAGYLGSQILSNWEYYNTYHGSDSTDIPGSTQVFGVTQMMGDTWHRIKPYVGQKLGSTELSLEVTFDSMAAGAYHVGNISLAWKNKISCEDWPVDYILYGACRYNGACPADTFGQKQYYNSYTYSVCASYNEYGGKQKNCQ